MDNNTYTHRAAIIDDYQESQGIARMAWPAYSPGLHPIENPWDALSRSVSLCFPLPAILIDLKTAQHEEWGCLILRWLTTILKAWSPGVNFVYR